MKRHYFTCILAVLTALVVGSFSFVAAASAQGSGNGAGPQAPTNSGGDGNQSAACLECHGPFEKLSSAPPFFVAPSGEKINPHRYVPHDLKEVPDCVSCHKPHSAEPTAAEIAALPKPNVTSCFECHHRKNFETCQHCHKSG